MRVGWRPASLLAVVSALPAAPRVHSLTISSDVRPDAPVRPLHRDAGVLNLDDRTGNVLTTIGFFAAVVGVGYAARTTLIVFMLALLVAYLLEPTVGWVEGRLPSHSNGRASAIATVYLTGLALIVAVGLTMKPAIAEQIHRLHDSVPEIRERLSDSGFLAQYGTRIEAAAKRFGPALGLLAEQTGWGLMVPLIAIFFLSNRQGLLDGIVDLLARRRDRARVRHTIEQIDTTLGQYTRAQLTTAALSMVFYIVSTALLGVPFPLALGVFAGSLEFLPVFGWILSAAVILAFGWAGHAHWIWMALVIGAWRVVLNFVISPRILGNRMAMEPISVFFALMAGGQIGGLAGVILAVPTVAVLRILWLERSSRRGAAAA
jgi:predicted PurR-regulated permease PerM